MHRSRALRPDRRRVLVALGTLGLAGCAGPGSEPRSQDRSTTSPEPSADRSRDRFSTADVHVITDYAGTRWETAWQEEIVPGFEAESGSSVAVEHTVENTRERLEALVQANDPPEVYHDTLAGVGDFVAHGVTEPVDDLVSDLEAANGPLVKPGSVRVDGQARIVPHGLRLGGVLNYRADVYETLGLSVPETWDELVANARAIDESEETDVRGFAVPAAGTPKSGLDFTNWLYTAGGDYWRWTDEDAGELTVDFQPEDVRAALDMMAELAQYSPGPSTMDYRRTIGDWVQGRVGQCLMDNAWLCGEAYRNDAEDIALHTQQALVPLADRSLDPIDHGWVATEGTPRFVNANAAAADEFLRYMYEGAERQGSRNAVTPMQFLPPYEGVLETEAYRSADLFTVEDGLLLERNRRCVTEIAPHLGGPRPQNTASLYASRYPIASELVRDGLADGGPTDDHVAHARERLRTRLQEGRNLLSN